MPKFKNRLSLKLAKGLNGFFHLDTGVVRGPAPDYEKMLEQARMQVMERDRELAQAKRRATQAEEQTAQAKRQAAKQAAEADRKAAEADRETSEKEEEIAGLREELEAIAVPLDTTEAVEKARTVGVGSPQDHCIGKVVENKSFADVGNLGSPAGEKISVAQSHGAAKSTMIDAAPEDDEAWIVFSERMRRFGVSDFGKLPASVFDLAYDPSRPVFDVVHCGAKILRRMPDPMRLLAALREITAGHLIVSGPVIETRVKNADGTLIVPSASAVFAPALKGREHDIVSSRAPLAYDGGASAMSSGAEHAESANGPALWWLPTVEAFKAMCEASGFDLEDGSHSPDRDEYTLLLSRRGGDAKEVRS